MTAGLLRPARRDVERLPGQEPARADSVMHSLTQQMHFGTTPRSSPLSRKVTRAFVKSVPKPPAMYGFGPGDFPVVLHGRTGREQHVQQVHVASTWRSMIVIESTRDSARSRCLR